MTTPSISGASGKASPLPVARSLSQNPPTQQSYSRVPSSSGLESLRSFESTTQVETSATQSELPRPRTACLLAPAAPHVALAVEEAQVQAGAQAEEEAPVPQPMLNPRESYQAAHENLKRNPTPENEESAHIALVAYSSSADTAADWGAVFHQAVTGAANSALTYSPRTATNFQADVTTASVAEAGNVVANVVSNVFVKPFTGPISAAVGQTVNQWVAVPAINTMFYQLEKSDDRAVLTQAMRADLNELFPNYGNQLAASIAEERSEAENPENFTAVSGPAFAGTSASSVLAGAFIPNPVGKALVGSIGSALAGAATGVAIGRSKSLAKMRIPKQEAIQLLKDDLLQRIGPVQAGGDLGASLEQMDNLDYDEINLNYARLMSAQDRRDKNQAAADARPQTVWGMAESFLNKGLEYGAGLLPATIIQGAGAAAASGISDIELATRVKAIANGVGIGLSLPRLGDAFPGLAGVPGRSKIKDAAIRARENPAGAAADGNENAVDVPADGNENAVVEAAEAGQLGVISITPSQLI